VGGHSPSLERYLKRPIGLAILAVVIVCYGLGGVGLTVVSFYLPEFHAAGPVFRLWGLAYGAAAFATAGGLWRCAPWTLRAYGVFALIAFGWVFMPNPLAEVLPPARPPWVTSALLIENVLFFGLGALYIRARLAPSSRGDAARA
jgi:hypothetical protein